MGKKQLIINFLILAFLFIVVYVVTQNATLIRQIFKKPQELVAGAQIKDPQGKDDLPKKLREDASSQLKAMKEGALDLTLGQVVTFVGKGGKVLEDVKNLQQTINEYITSTK